MSPTIGLPPPEPESCLVTSRVSRFKGGTVVDEDVRDLDAHMRRIRSPDGYRPMACPRCGHDGLHAHGYRERRPRGDAGMPPVIDVALYLCANADCGATWRVLPLFLARHLWRTWRTVERAVKPADTPAPAGAPVIPRRTRARWMARLMAAARVLVVLLAVSGGAALAGLAAATPLDATRMTLVDAHAVVATARVHERLSTLATLTHRLERGIRLM